MVIWLCGMSAVGKTTIGSELVNLLRAEGRPVIFLDGDALRSVWSDNLGHSLEARRFNARRISHLCRMLDSQFVDIVAAVLYPFPEWMLWNRQNLRQYFEVFIDAPMEVLEHRDPKGIYAGARAGQVKDVVGIDIPFARPTNSDLVVFNGEPLRSPAAIAQQIRSAMPPFCN